MCYRKSNRRREGIQLTNRNALVHKPYNKFKGFMRENSLTYKDIASTLGLTISTVSMKINGHSDFYLNEVALLKSKYGLSSDIFL